uniref:Hepcidin antimicrobial peptide n=1 Tax=Capra hircus TaxID=9925 RepID=A0A452G6G3_CAPHI
MALSTQTRATCLLLLVLLSLTSGSVLPPQTRQLTDLQTQHTAGAAAASPTFPFLCPLRPAHCPSFPQRRRDTHFPICIFCCGCCRKGTCGMCCKT